MEYNYIKNFPFASKISRIPSGSKIETEIYLSVPDMLTHREIFSESCYSKPNLDCKYCFPIDLTPISIQIGVKSIAK